MDFDFAHDERCRDERYPEWWEGRVALAVQDDWTLEAAAAVADDDVPFEEAS